MTDPRTDPLPDSGDGVAPPSPADLPRPALWEPPRGRHDAPAAFRGRAEDDADVPPRTRGRLLLVYGAVTGMVLAAVLLGVAFVSRSLLLGGAGLVLGLACLALALGERVLAMVSVGQSPVGPG